MLQTERRGDTLTIYSEGKGRKSKVKVCLYYPEWSGLSESEKEESHKREAERLSELFKEGLFMEEIMPRYLRHLERLEKEGFFLFGYDTECFSPEYEKGLKKAKLYLRGGEGELGSVNQVFVKRNNRERFHRLVIKGIFLGYYSLERDMVREVEVILRGGYAEWEARAWHACKCFVESL